MNRYTYQPHAPQKRRGIPWPVCAGCGLLYLHNDVTAWCVQKGCNAVEHPDWPRLYQLLGGP